MVETGKAAMMVGLWLMMAGLAVWMIMWIRAALRQPDWRSSIFDFNLSRRLAFQNRVFAEARADENRGLLGALGNRLLQGGTLALIGGGIVAGLGLWMA